MILSIDPGSETTGWAFLQLPAKGRDLELASCGVLRPPKSEGDFEARFAWLVLAMDELIAKKQPTEFVIEKQFAGPNASSMIKLALLAGAFLGIATLQRIPTYAYEPSSWKMSLGSGNLTKTQARDALAHIGLAVPPDAPMDVSDAVGIGYHHYHAVWYDRMGEDNE